MLKLASAARSPQSPNAKCKLRSKLNASRYLLLEEEFVSNQARFRFRSRSTPLAVEPLLAGSASTR
jgi:hypothetical protein